MSNDNDPAAAAPKPSWLQSAWRTFVMHDRFSLTAGSIISVVLTLWIARTLEIPGTPERAGTLLQQANWALAVVLACAAVLGTSVIAAIIASRLHYDGGLFCGCVALAALSTELGPMRFALFGASSKAIFAGCAVELLVLGGAVALAWSLLRRGAQTGWLPPEDPLDSEPDDLPIDQKLLATAAQAIITLVVLMLLSNADTKKQTIAVVGLASYLGALGAHHFVSAQPSVWFLIGPIAVGVFGYLAQYMGGGEWVIGDPRGFFAPLVRPMPLDYAGAGPAGALLGYWTSRHWQHTAANAPDTPEAASR